MSIKRLSVLLALLILLTACSQSAPVKEYTLDCENGDVIRFSILEGKVFTLNEEMPLKVLRGNETILAVGYISTDEWLTYKFHIEAEYGVSNVSFGEKWGYECIFYDYEEGNEGLSHNVLAHVGSTLLFVSTMYDESTFQVALDSLDISLI